jgi:hypothetical protein
MKFDHTIRTGIFFAAFAIGLGGAAAAFSETSYVMTCRGGGDMKAVAGQRVSQNETFAEITFRRAAQGAGVQAPQPGECAWIDRGVAAGEPNVIYYVDQGVAWTQTVCQHGACWVNTPSQGITTLMKAVSTGQSFQVHVYNDRAGHMVVTRVGP